MDMITISRVSQAFGISTRTLRYYEQIEILPSLRVDGYAYRVYNEKSIARLRQIILLRKLRIPLKQISRIFADSGTETMLEVFLQSASELNEEITALETMRLILKRFITELQSRTDLPLQAMLFDDEIILDALNSLSRTKIAFKEERSMDELNRAHGQLTELKDVRIIQLPPYTVASFHYIGEDPEESAGEVMSKALKDMNLYEIKPDARMFGFNHPNPSENREHYGYEVWVTIPDDLEVPAPLVKKHFIGGLYAVHTITMPNFHEWKDLHDWVRNSDKYEPNDAPEAAEIMGGWLEEHLNWVYHNHLGWPDHLGEGQLDLYEPIKLK